MLVKGNKVIGAEIMTLREGQRVGDVKDIVYDPRENAVKALLLDGGSWFSDAKLVLLSEVRSIGENVVMIETGDAIKTAKEIAGPVAEIAKDKQYLTKTKLVTETGDTLGVVSDIVFDDKTGKVVEFEVSQGLIKNVQSGVKRVRVTDILTVGADATIVRGATAMEFEAQAQRQGLQGAVNTARQQAPSVVESVKQKSREAAESARQWVRQSGIKEQFKETTDKAEATAAKAMETVKEKGKEAAGVMKEKLEQPAQPGKMSGEVIITEESRKTVTVPPNADSEQWLVGALGGKATRKAKSSKKDEE